MEPFDDGGVFWLSNSPDYRVSANLNFDGEAFTLSTDASLVQPKIPAGQGDPRTIDRVVHPVVLGRMRRLGEVTLLNVNRVSRRGLDPNAREEWSACAALLGSHVGNPVFSRAAFSFDVLVSWANPPSLVNWDSPAGDTIDLTRHELDRACVNESIVRLTADWAGEAGDDAVDVRRQCWLRVDLPSLGLSDLLERWVGPLQDMLIILLGRPVRLTDLSVVPVGGPDETENGATGRSSSVRVVFGGLMAAPGTKVSWASLRNWGTPTMFVREDLPIGFGELVKGWFAARAEFSEAVALLCSPFYAPFMYSEQRYAAIFQSAEAAARLKYAGPERTKQKHRARVRAIVDAARAADVLDEDVGWAERVLRSRNDKTLAQLIGELLADIGVLGDKIIERDPEFAGTTASTRARVSHPGGQAVTTEQRYWYGEVLLWIMRARLATEAGLPLEGITAQILDRGHFTQTVEQIEAPRGYASRHGSA